MFSFSKKFLSLTFLLVSTELFATEPVLQITKETYAQEIEKAQKPFILDVFAEWCGPCKNMKPIFNAFAQQYKDQYICAAIDHDKASDIAKSLGVTGLPTMVVIINQKVVGKVVGQKSAEELKKEIDKIVAQAGKSLKELSKEELAKKFEDALLECSLPDIAHLVDVGIDVNAVLPNGLTPLFMVISQLARFGDEGVKVVELLLMRGASTKEIQLAGMPQAMAPRAIIVSTVAYFQQMIDNYNKVLALLDAKSVKAK